MVNAELRGIVAKTIIDVLRGYSVLNFGSTDVCANIEENLIMAAIVVGQADGRLLTATDIAAYIGLPRPTVIRKLGGAAMHGALSKVKDGNRACYYIRDPNNDRTMAEIRRVMLTIRQGCDRLSKLDTRKLDGKTATY